MKAPEDFEVMQGYSRYHLSGHSSVMEGASKIIDVIIFSREQGIHNLLVDATNWTDHERATTLLSYEIGSAFAKEGRGAVKLSMVLQPDIMHPDKFGVTVARNRGLDVNAFDSEKDALSWLLEP
jgi:hypothetical protein